MPSAAPKLEKGTLFVRERALLYRFMFNPESIEVTKAVNYPNETPAGGSHPIYQWASGGEHLLTFTLYLDGDRGRSDSRPKGLNRAGVNQNAGAGNFTNLSNGTSGTLNVMDEVRLLQSLLMPSRYGKTAKDVYPYTCVFTFGESFPSVVVVVKKADPKLNFFTPQLGTVRSTVSMQLGIVKPAYETASEFAPTPTEQAAVGIAKGISDGIAAAPAIFTAAGSSLSAAGKAAETYLGNLPGNFLANFER